MKRDTLIVNIGVNLWPFSDTMWQLLLQSFIQILVLSKSPLIKPTHKLGMFSWLHLRHGQWKYTLLLFFTFFFFFCPIEKQWLKIYIPNIYLIPKYNLGVRFTPRKRYIYTNSNKETIRSTLCFFFFSIWPAYLSMNACLMASALFRTANLSSLKNLTIV